MAGQSGYSSSEILSMQNDAVRRVNEMQRMAKARVGNAPPPNQTQNDQHVNQQNTYENTNSFEQNVNVSANSQQNDGINVENNANNCDETQENPSVLSPISDSFKGIIEKLDLDTEKIMLMMLIFLLISEGGETKLVLALGYILLTG